MSKKADRYIAMLNKADEIYQKDYSTGEYCHEQSFKWGFQEGYEQTEKDLGWHSVDDCLPPIDEEVVILQDVASEVAEEPLYCIAFGHVIDPDVVVSVKDTPYKVVSHNGWNIPRVRYWMPMPKIPNEDE